MVSWSEEEAHPDRRTKQANKEKRGRNTGTWQGHFMRQSPPSSQPATAYSYSHHTALHTDFVPSFNTTPFLLYEDKKIKNKRIIFFPMKRLFIYLPFEMLSHSSIFPFSPHWPTRPHSSEKTPKPSPPSPPPSSSPLKLPPVPTVT